MLRPERIHNLRLPRRPTAGEGLHTQLEEARELAYDVLCTVIMYCVLWIKVNALDCYICMPTRTLAGENP